MEKKKKNTKKKTNTKKNKKNIKIKDNKMIIFSVCLVILLMLIIFICLKGTYSASGTVTFRGDTGYNLGNSTHYNAPPDGECAIDEKGFMDYQCAHQIACVCREWSTTKSGTLKDSEGNITCEWPCQGTALYNNDIFTTRFSNGEVFYCKGGTSYASPCDVELPTEKCYECTTSDGKKHVKTINSERAAVYTGGNNCAVVSDSVCNPTATPTPTPVPTKTPTPTPTATPTPVPTNTPTPTPSTSCYECKLGEGVEHAYAQSATSAANKTGGTDCEAVANSKCTDNNPSCYECTDGDITKTGYFNSVDEARTGTDINNCTIVTSDRCEIIVNPQTGTKPIIIIMSIISILGIGYIIMQLRKK